jgi:hypothetical protein
MNVQWVVGRGNKRAERTWKRSFAVAPTRLVALVKQSMANVTMTGKVVLTAQSLQNKRERLARL